MIAGGLASKDHPIDWRTSFPCAAAIWRAPTATNTTIRSKPVPLDTMYQRLDRLARLGTTIITISGGEPLLHPDLDLPSSRAFAGTA